MAIRILIVDDEPTIRETLSVVLNEEGYNAETAANGQEALEKLTENNFDLVITDLKMPEIGGIELLEKIKQKAPRTSVMIITAYATVESAIQALRLGAYDYMIKPLEFDDVILRIQRLIEHRELINENEFLRREVQDKFSFSNIIGESPQMQDIFRLIQKVAGTKGNILISGRSGTGKELVARAIHYNSNRKKKRFVAINCGAIVDNLMESELFGHKKGAFTGAVRDKEGLFQIADKGTLFLDEVGEIPLHLQVKLLRAIETGEFLPVGETTPVKVDVRIIAATNRDLEKEVEEGNFRDDLFYRLNVIGIQLPSLQERKEDIPLLVNHFINKYNRELNRQIQAVDEETMWILMNHEWRGGIRELENVIERALILCERDVITKTDLPPNLVRVEPPAEKPLKLKEAVAEFEKEHLARVLRTTEGDKEQAARILGISLSSLYRKIDELKVVFS
ncbi:MAG: sigma-54 dependent transcriptional regulator [Calditrichia bacterium]